LLLEAAIAIWSPAYHPRFVPTVIEVDPAEAIAYSLDYLILGAPNNLMSPAIAMTLSPPSIQVE
jgi:hypothetical protein